MYKLSLVVPCYNESKNLTHFYEAVTNAFKDNIKDYEIIFVNDGSDDNTQDVLTDIVCGSMNKNIKVINFSRNFGKEAAILAGLKESTGKYTSLIDADMQQDPCIVVKMVNILDEKEDIDCVAAFQSVRHEGALLGFFKNTFYDVINKISDTKFTQGASDFRTFRRNVLDAILSMKEYSRFSKGIFSWVGFNTKFISYEAKPRLEGTSKWSFKKLFRYAIDGITAFTVTPLKIATYTGIMSIISSLICLIAFLAYDLNVAHCVNSGHVIIILMLFLAGMQFLFTGIIGEYVAKNYMQGKNRPLYIIKSKISGEQVINENSKIV